MSLCHKVKGYVFITSKGHIVIHANGHVIVWPYGGPPMKETGSFSIQTKYLNMLPMSSFILRSVRLLD